MEVRQPFRFFFSIYLGTGIPPGAYVFRFLSTGCYMQRCSACFVTVTMCLCAEDKLMHSHLGKLNWNNNNKKQKQTNKHQFKQNPIKYRKHRQSCLWLLAGFSYRLRPCGSGPCVICCQTSRQSTGALLLKLPRGI